MYNEYYKIYKVIGNNIHNLYGPARMGNYNKSFDYYFIYSNTIDDIEDFLILYLGLENV